MKKQIPFYDYRSIVLKHLSAKNYSATPEELSQISCDWYLDVPASECAKNIMFS